MTSTAGEQLDGLRRGTEAIYNDDELRAKLSSGRELRIKLGMDPTAPHIHLGHAVVLRKMRHFQDLGHKAVLIIGDYTARIGDPTGRDTTRPMLDEATIDQNARTYLDQAGKILDTREERLEIRKNSEWLGRLDLGDVLRIASQFTVQQMLHRENFRQRMDQGRSVMVSELLYPLMQAYDSVVIGADVELGGTDQTFNNLCGRDIMGRYGQSPQCVMICPILTGVDGTEKMSKSHGNHVALTDDADEMYGKLMSIPDSLMANYYRLLTPIPESRIRSLLDPETTHPRDAKDILSRTIVEDFWGRSQANAAAEEFKRRFADRDLPSEMAVHEIDEEALGLGRLIRAVGFASSNSEARRLISQGAVTFDGEKITDPMAQVTIPADHQAVLQVGKRRVCAVQRTS